MLILDADAKTSAAHGCKPSERSVEQLLQAGIIVIDKPAGPNSHQVSAWARDILGVDKLGHGGTLDPFAKCFAASFGSINAIDEKGPRA